MKIHRTFRTQSLERNNTMAGILSRDIARLFFIGNGLFPRNTSCILFFIEQCDFSYTGSGVDRRLAAVDRLVNVRSNWINKYVGRSDAFDGQGYVPARHKTGLVSQPVVDSKHCRCSDHRFLERSSNLCSGIYDTVRNKTFVTNDVKHR